MMLNKYLALSIVFVLGSVTQNVPEVHPDVYATSEVSALPSLTSGYDMYMIGETDEFNKIPFPLL
jgi:hypothetical protein